MAPAHVAHDEVPASDHGTHQSPPVVEEIANNI
jgi:hypothetical protein